MTMKRNINNHKKTTVTTIVFLSLLMLCMIVYWLVPKTSMGHIRKIDLLKQRYSLYNVPYFKTKGDLLFIEESYFLSHQIVVFGLLGDDLNTFCRNFNMKDLDRSSATSFRLPPFVGNLSKALLSSWKIERIRETNEYMFSNATEQIKTEILSFRIMGSRHRMIFDPVSKFFAFIIITR